MSNIRRAALVELSDDVVRGLKIACAPRKLQTKICADHEREDVEAAMRWLDRQSIVFTGGKE